MKMSKMSHYIPYDAPGKFTARTLCGYYTDRRDVSKGGGHSNEPTCPTCKERLVAYHAEADFGDVNEPDATGQP
jgi:hypothetical protein